MCHNPSPPLPAVRNQAVLDIAAASYLLASRTNCGTGIDTCVFDDGHSGKCEGNANVRTDFSQAKGDIIDLTAIGTITGADDDAFAITGSSASTGVADELITFTIFENTFVAGEVDGDGFADFQIRLDRLHDLIAADIVLKQVAEGGATPAASASSILTIWRQLSLAQTSSERTEGFGSMSWLDP